MKRSAFIFAIGTAAAAMASQAQATPTNEGTPAGSIVGSLTGDTISTTYAGATFDFTAAGAATNITFAIREDPAFIELSNISVVDLTTSSGNLLLNGNFGLGPVGSNSPTDWAFLNPFGASFSGNVNTGCGAGVTATNPNNNCYFDGSVQAYDAINQIIATTIGNVYAISFDYADTCPGACTSAGGVTTYQPLSTNGDDTDTGGNGRDLFVYAGTTTPFAPPTGVPEPVSLSLFGAGLAGLGLIRRRRSRKA